MIKSKTVLEQEYNGKNYQFITENDAGLGQVYDVLVMMMAYVVERINQNIPQQSAPQQDNKEGQNDCSNTESADCS